MLKLKNLDRSIKRLSDLRLRTYDKKHLDAVGTELVVRHRDEVPVDDGVLRGSLRHRVTPGGWLAVGATRDGWYWRFVEYGTEPHAVEARRWAKKRRRRGKKVLADVERGIVFGVRLLKGHPGARPRPFIRPVIDSARGAITRTLARSLGKAI